MTEQFPCEPIHDFPGGVHPEENKEQSTRTPIATPPLPKRLMLPLNQHSGAPARTAGKAWEIHVLKGQMLATGCWICQLAPVHAPTSGTKSPAIEMHPVPHWSGLEESCLILSPMAKMSGAPSLLSPITTVTESREIWYSVYTTQALLASVEQASRQRSKCPPAKPARFTH